MNRPLQIGITGGIGSGKSLVCRIFNCLGIPIYDADSRAKSIMTTDGILISQIKKEFGDLSYDEEGRVNRQYLSQVVFSDPVKLSLLNRLVHPRVGLDYARWAEANASAKFLLKEAAVLFETDSYKLLDQIIVVYAPLELRMKRVQSRDPHRSRKQIEDIMKQQLSEDEKMKRADHVIYNDEVQLLIPQVLRLHDNFVNHGR